MFAAESKNKLDGLLATLLNTSTDVSRKYREKEQRIGQLTQEIDELRQQLTVQLGKHTSLEEEYATLNSEKQELQNAKDIVDAELASLRQQGQTRTAEYAALLDERDLLKEQHAAALSEIDIYEVTIKEVEEQITKIVDQLAAIDSVETPGS